MYENGALPYGNHKRLNGSFRGSFLNEQRGLIFYFVHSSLHFYFISKVRNELADSAAKFPLILLFKFDS